MATERKRDKFDAMREDAIERILTASTQLFSDYGYAATTIQMIADRAKVVPSGIYHYYAGKSDLLKAVVDRLVQKVETLLTDSGIIFVEKAQIIDFFGILYPGAQGEYGGCRIAGHVDPAKGYAVRLFGKAAGDCSICLAEIASI